MKVGVLGGGQLARMLALAGHPLGVELAFLDPAPDACAAGVARQHRAAFTDAAAVARLAAEVDVLTFEFEHAAPEVLASAAPTAIHPAPAALAATRDRLHEKILLRGLGIPTPAFAAVDSREDLVQAVAELGLPLVLKTRTMGYDGKGQGILRSAAGIDALWQRLGGHPLIAEAFVPFQREVSIIIARARSGETACYPLSENLHRGGILHRSCSRPQDPLTAPAHELAERVVEALDYVGVLALELFDHGGRLVANEIAPRVHNSGHWTIEGARSSQFENHLRAILGLPLGDTAAVGLSAMVNLVGSLPPTAAVLAVPGAHLHCYGKAPRPGRKLGHITLQAEDPKVLATGLAAIEDLVASAARTEPTRTDRSGKA